MYWYASAYESEGFPDVEAYEILTNENELAMIKEKVRLDNPQATEEEVVNLIAERASGIKGNAIPAVILEEMFDSLTDKDRQFAMKIREAFTSFWPLINPVYSRATGVNMTQIESYIPRIRVTKSKMTVEDMFKEYALIEGHVTAMPGFTKERRATSTAP